MNCLRMRVAFEAKTLRDDRWMNAWMDAQTDA